MRSRDRKCVKGARKWRQVVCKLLAIFSAAQALELSTNVTRQLERATDDAVDKL